MNSLFRKELKLRSNNKLKSRDLKRLRGDVLKTFPQLTDTLVDALFPSQSSVYLLRYEGRVSVYMCAENPLFFEAYDTVFPTLYSLAMTPNILPCVVVFPPVSKYVLNGADLMCPGIAWSETDQSIRKGHPCSIRVQGNRIPFAVGFAEVDMTRTRLRGKAVSVTHRLGDLLWNMGTETRFAGFTSHMVFPESPTSPLSSAGAFERMEVEHVTSQDMDEYGADAEDGGNDEGDENGNADDDNDGDGDGDDDDDDDDDDEGNTGSVVDKMGDEEKEADVEMMKGEIGKEEHEQSVVEEGDLKETIGEESLEEDMDLLTIDTCSTSHDGESASDVDADLGKTETDHIISGTSTGDDAEDVDKGDCGIGSSGHEAASTLVEEVFSPDQRFLKSFLDGATKVAHEPIFPMSANNFYSQYITPSVDIKKTSYKKLMKFLQFLRTKGAIRLKLKKSGMILEGIETESAGFLELLTFCTTPLGMDGRSAEEEKEDFEQAIERELHIEHAWKVPKSLRSILPNEDYKVLITADSVHFLVQKYAERNGLLLHDGGESPAMMEVDEFLRKEVVRKAGGDRKLDSHPIDDVVKMVLRVSSERTIVTRGAHTKSFASATMSPIRILSEKKNGRWITSVCGIDAYLVDPHLMARLCQRKFATSATVTKNAEQVLVVQVQGNVPREVAHFAHHEFGIPTSLIDVKRKTEKSKKK